MSQAEKRLEAMRRNSKDGWTIDDVQVVCDAHGADLVRSRAGSSHYKVKHPAVPSLLTIPFARPIKPVYIRKLVAFLDLARAAP